MLTQRNLQISGYLFWNKAVESKSVLKDHQVQNKWRD